jgi:hypothetical protein
LLLEVHPDEKSARMPYAETISGVTWAARRTAISSKYRANPSPAGTMEHWAGRIPAAQRDLARR